MTIRKAHPLCGQPVDIWRRNLAAIRIVTGDIAKAEVVGVEDDDVGIGRCRIEVDRESSRKEQQL